MLLLIMLIVGGFGALLLALLAIQGPSASRVPLLYAAC